MKVIILADIHGNLPALKRVELQGLWPGQETVELMFRRFDRFDY